MIRMVEKKAAKPKKKPVAPTDKKPTEPEAARKITLAELDEDPPKADTPVRLIFPCSREMADKIETQRYLRKLKSTSATIRVLLEEALK